MRHNTRWFMLFLSIATIVAFTSSCNLPFANNSTAAPNDAIQTLVALGLTETALAFPQPQQSQEPPTAISTPMTPPDNTAVPVVHLIMPREMQAIESTIDDVKYGGDSFAMDLYERPYTEINMVYHGDVDLQKGLLSTDNTFFYFSLNLKDVNPDTKKLGANYGAELDVDQDGRGDFLIWAFTPPVSTTWDIAGVAVYADQNDDVGSLHPLASDAPKNGDGYETEVWPSKPLTDPDGAWSRIDPNNPLNVQIAVKRSLLGNPASFLWSVWADDQIKTPGLFDYNDAMTLSEAGSPYQGTSDYPLKKLALVDNTCREAWNFKPKGNEPGYCKVIPHPTQATTPGKPLSTAALVTGTPRVITETPVFITNTPIIITDTPSIITKTPSVITKTPHVVTPTPTFTPTPNCPEVVIGAQVTDGSTWNPDWASGVTLCVGGECQHPDTGGFAYWYRPSGSYTITATSNYGITPAEVTLKLGCAQKSLTQFVIGPG